MFLFVLIVAAEKLGNESMMLLSVLRPNPQALSRNKSHLRSAEQGFSQFVFALLRNEMSCTLCLVRVKGVKEFGSYGTSWRREEPE